MAAAHTPVSASHTRAFFYSLSLLSSPPHNRTERSNSVQKLRFLCKNSYVIPSAVTDAPSSWQLAKYGSYKQGQKDTNMNYATFHWSTCQNIVVSPPRPNKSHRKFKPYSLLGYTL